jgi:ppGpp synthetase/RelA/SpoT-type nucleotidyltranferase
MDAIRGKLRRMDERTKPLGLEEFQDLGGCRAIMRTMRDVDALVGVLRARCRHVIWDENDYIREARKTGYRSQHLKFEFQGTGDRLVHNGCRVQSS